MIITLPKLAAEALGSILASDMQRAYGSSHARLTELIPMAAQVALDCIGISDALYHNVEHTMLVTLVARDIAYGRWLLVKTTAEDDAHLFVACLMHDIGYVRGILKGDEQSGYVVDDSGQKVSLPRGSSDAALIARAIEATRFPPSAPPDEEDIDEEGSLVRAADFIGQLGDPNYLRKANALYYEFEETGMNRQRGYNSPADVIEQYPQFYWSTVSPRVQTAIRYLNVTATGRQWIANLYSNVFRAERHLT